jgi:hypothetical protein
MQGPQLLADGSLSALLIKSSKDPERGTLAADLVEALPVILDTVSLEPTVVCYRMGINFKHRSIKVLRPRQ